MRVLVHGGSLAIAGPRLAHAAAGLELRGHDVQWAGPGAPAGSPRPGAAFEADVVVGGPRPLSVATAGWRTRARAMVIGATGATVAGWGRVDRWAWESLAAIALIDEGDAPAVRGRSAELALERFGLWSPDAAPAEPDVAHADVEILERACERAIARAVAIAPRAGVFVDRDGTLVVERGYLADPDDIELLPGVARALRAVRAAGHPVVVISNQSGVGRGLFPLSRVYEAMARLRRLLRTHGVELDAIYFCPHRPDEGCACRKPGTRLLERAADDLVLSLQRSLMVGDKRLDAATGQAAGGTGILVRTGYGRDEEARIADGEFDRAPDRVCDDLEQALALFLAYDEARDAG